jgi:hypothetical protein
MQHLRCWEKTTLLSTIQSADCGGNRMRRLTLVSLLGENNASQYEPITSHHRVTTRLVYPCG